EKFLAQITGHFELLDDEFANQFINDLGHYLISPLETKYFPFHFYIVKDNSLNAFAAPGGHIFIFSGLVHAMESIDELAAVICHEIGHVSARHMSDRMEQSKKIGFATMAAIMAGALIGGVPAEALITGSMAAGIQAQLHFSREDERQADQLGFKYMKSADFNPAGMITTLNKIQKGNLLGTDKVPAYLLTHPTGPERMSNLDTMLSQYSPARPKIETARFREVSLIFQTIVRAKCLDPNEAERFFRLELEKTPGAILPNLGLGIVYKEKTEYSKAIHHLNKALELEPDFIPILTTLGEVYQMKGKYTEALRVLEAALKLDAGDRAALFLLGLSYENMEQHEKALRFFERLASFEPVKNEVYYHLGLSYGKQGKLVLAHYNFGLYFSKLGQARIAGFHFRKAHDLSGDDPTLRRKIREATEGLKRLR
ncbi:MAG: M48 family metalloprotease, partial [Thermodesulfobacteriota bacterium]|nr:M48 family metalloprotease [Thermodesulfobacteriota bacterium]